MWKIVVGFVLFAAVALFVLSRGGDIDMGGEKHGDMSHTASPPASALVPVSAPASAPMLPASTSTAPASATK